MVSSIDKMAKNFLYLLKKKDIKTYQHSIATEQHAMHFAKYLQLPQEQQVIARYAGALHDIGKLFVPDYILKKPSNLTDEEFEIIKEHPVLGYQIFRQYWHNQDNKYVNLIGEAILHHHERLDGRGYPDGISIDSLPIITSIVSICDVYSALLLARYYKPAYSLHETLEILDKEKGKQFQPELLEEFFIFVQKNNSFK